MRFPVVFSCPLLLLAACSDFELKEHADDPDPFEDPSTAPDITVEPPALDFGALATGATSDAQVVTVSNVGDAVLDLDDVSLADPTAPFAVYAPESSVLQPGESTTFVVTFCPVDDGVAEGEVQVSSNDADEPVVGVALSGSGEAPDITIEPQLHDFGTLDFQATASVAVTVRNDGVADLHITDILYTTLSSELTMRPVGPALTLTPGASTTVTIDYAPIDDVADEGYFSVYSDDPDEGVAYGNQIGNGRVFEGFSTGWYIVDDSTNYETTSNPSYSISSYGDPDGYWYEPSGAHGLVGSTDPAGDFATMHDYVIARAGAPTPVTAPLSFYSTSTVPTFSYASYSYILCDFWIDSTDDPNLYEVRAGTDDDGAQVMVNGEIMTNWYLGAAGAVNIGSAIVPGAVNSLIVILMDNSASDKYITDLGFYRDGVFVSG